MDLFHAIILGLVEGITEFLPISSTGHLMLSARLLGLSQTDFLKSFEIAIQLGAILAVVALYARTVFTNWEVIKRIIVAFIPTGILGLLFYKIVKTYLLGSNAVVVWSLLIGGAILIIFELWHKEREGSVKDLAELTYPQALLIGLFQSVAMVPGVSRAAATIVGGLILGVSRTAIVEFSFLLAIPTMAAATALDLFKNISLFSASQLDFLAVGFVTAFIAAIIAIKFLLKFIQNHTFIPFGIYRIIIALIFLFIFTI